MPVPLMPCLPALHAAFAAARRQARVGRVQHRRVRSRPAGDGGAAETTCPAAQPA